MMTTKPLFYSIKINALLCSRAFQPVNPMRAIRTHRNFEVLRNNKYIYLMGSWKTREYGITPEAAVIPYIYGDKAFWTNGLALWIRPTHNHPSTRRCNKYHSMISQRGDIMEWYTTVSNRPPISGFDSPTISFVFHLSNQPNFVRHIFYTFI